MLNRVLIVWLLLTGGACLKAAVDGGTPSDRVARVGLCLFTVTTAWSHVSESKVRKEPRS